MLKSKNYDWKLKKLCVNNQNKVFLNYRINNEELLL